MYIFRSDNRLEVPITLHSFKGMAEEVTLIDSGTTENFIDQETIKKLKLGSKKLSEPIQLRNIDGTYNQSGSVTHFIDLLVNRGGRKIMQRFYVTNLGSDGIILGYPWLRAFNPDINWPNCKLVGPKVKMETMLHARNPRLREMLANKWGVFNSTIPIQDKPDQVDLVVRNTEIAKTLNNGQITEIAKTPNNGHDSEIAETLNNGHNKEDLLLESAMCEEASQQAVEANMSYGETVMEARKTIVNELSPLLRLDEPDPEKSLKDYVPEHYHGYLDVFMEKEAIPLPLHRPWDHVVTLTPDAPPSISCRVYPLSHREEEFQAKYIKEQEDTGLIQKSKSPYSTPIFYIKKKNGSYCPIFDYQKINTIMVKDVFPLPHIDMIIEGMHRMVLFSKFDLCNGY
jgi:hypothetical protein